jgi:DNA-binding CsgD family transcriptional regulator
MTHPVHNDVAMSAGVLALVARLYTGAPPAYGLAAPPNPPPHAHAGDPVRRVRDGLESAEREAAAALLDELPFGILVLDATCHCEYANRTARAALDEGEFLSLDGEIVRAALERDSQALAALAVQIATLPSALDGVPLLVGRRTGRAVRLLALPLHVQGRALLVLLVPDVARARALRRLLGSLFGLTAAEADVAVLMLEGMSLDQVAHERRVTLSTARGHWQTAVWKVGVSREALTGILQRALLISPLADTRHGRGA